MISIERVEKIDNGLRLPDFLDKPQPRNKELEEVKAEVQYLERAYKDLAFTCGCSVLVVVCMTIGFCAAIF